MKASRCLQFTCVCRIIDPWKSRWLPFLPLHLTASHTPICLHFSHIEYDATKFKMNNYNEKRAPYPKLVTC